MPRYWCDYCEAYLTHDSPSVRKQHNYGFKHKANVRNYYSQFESAKRIFEQTHSFSTRPSSAPAPPGRGAPPAAPANRGRPTPPAPGATHQAPPPPPPAPSTARGRGMPAPPPPPPQAQPQQQQNQPPQQ